MTTTTSIHDASNKSIEKFYTKQQCALDAIISIAGESPEGAKLERTATQLIFEYEVNGNHAFTIFVKYYAEGYKVNAYRKGMEEYDFRNIPSFSNAVKIIKLIAFKMKSETK